MLSYGALLDESALAGYVDREGDAQSDPADCLLASAERLEILEVVRELRRLRQARRTLSEQAKGARQQVRDLEKELSLVEEKQQSVQKRLLELSLGN